MALRDDPSRLPHLRSQHAANPWMKICLEVVVIRIKYNVSLYISSLLRFLTRQNAEPAAQTRFQTYIHKTNQTTKFACVLEGQLPPVDIEDSKSIIDQCRAFLYFAKADERAIAPDVPCFDLAWCICLEIDNEFFHRSIRTEEGPLCTVEVSRQAMDNGKWANFCLKATDAERVDIVNGAERWGVRYGAIRGLKGLGVKQDEMDLLLWHI